MFTWWGMNSITTVKTVSVCLRHRLHIGKKQDFYLKPDFALCFPLIFFLRTEVLVPNSPRIGWDMV